MVNNARNNTAEQLRKCRISCGLSQLQVANTLGIDRTTYTCYENGRIEPNLKIIAKLSQIFDVDVSLLLPKEGPSSLKDSDAKSNIPFYLLSKEEKTLILNYRLLSDNEKSDILAKITNMSKADK